MEDFISAGEATKLSEKNTLSQDFIEKSILNDLQEKIKNEAKTGGYNISVHPGHVSKKAVEFLMKHGYKCEFKHAETSLDQPRWRISWPTPTTPIEVIEEL